MNIERPTSNIEYRTRNHECRMSIDECRIKAFFLFLLKRQSEAIPPFVIIHYSLFNSHFMVVS
ncbi:hypothetical protein D1AOALGA4SA_9740 [Olavius algarvensis Delta 1 endosymbiont]|nr:hypothetical protein D1AOALGA4SA_9740 [Olavius algarvensis Delta 1 endosymbiont]